MRRSLGWAVTDKDIAVVVGQPVAAATPSDTGRPLAATSLTFGAPEMWLSTARTLHRRELPPAVRFMQVNMASVMMRSYVDPAAGPFFLNASIGSLKDFARSFLVGAFGSALSYIAMRRSGYLWLAHFEDLDPATLSGPRPDFAFLKALTFEVALTEAKGTTSKSRKLLQDDLHEDYLKQVEPWIGMPRGPVIPDHGFAVGSWLTSVKAAEMRFAHTPPLLLKSNPGVAPPRRTRSFGAARVQHLHYSGAMGFLFGDAVEDAVIERGLILGPPGRQLELNDIELPAATAFGTTWLTAAGGLYPWYGGFVPALPADVAEQALRRGMLATEVPAFDGPAVGAELIGRVAEAGGVVLPDGLALLPRASIELTNRHALLTRPYAQAPHSGFRTYGSPRGPV